MKTNQQLALEVIAGKWGNGLERRQKLEASGYSYAAVQSIVNAVMSNSEIPEEKTNLMKVDFDIKKYDGLEVTIIT